MRSPHQTSAIPWVRVMSFCLGFFVIWVGPCFCFGVWERACLFLLFRHQRPHSHPGPTVSKRRPRPNSKKKTRPNIKHPHHPGTNKPNTRSPLHVRALFADRISGHCVVLVVVVNSARQLNLMSKREKIPRDSLTWSRNFRTFDARAQSNVKMSEPSTHQLSFEAGKHMPPPQWQIQNTSNPGRTPRPPFHATTQF